MRKSQKYERLAKIEKLPLFVRQGSSLYRNGKSRKERHCKAASMYTAWKRAHDEGYRVSQNKGSAKRMKDWYDRNKAKAIQQRSDYRKRNRHKVVAHNLVNEAIQSGQLKRPKKCEICRKKCRPHGHHEDYSKPLDVIWVCHSCHGKIHAGYLKVS